MNSDIRIKVGFHRHPKIRKLRKELGADGVLSLLALWGHVAENRPDGNLAGMDAEDIALAAEWEGEPGKFVGILRSLRLLDKVGKGFVVHDWEIHNAYAAAAPFRSEKARKAALTRWGVDAPSIPEHCFEHPRAMPVAPLRNAPDPSPDPSPDPDPEDRRSTPSAPTPGNGDGSGSVHPPVSWSKSITWNKVEGCFEGITPEIIAKWKVAYPAVNLEAQLNRADEWLKANPTKQKQNNYRFLVNWMSRAQERGGR